MFFRIFAFTPLLPFLRSFETGPSSREQSIAPFSRLGLPLRPDLHFAVNGPAAGKKRLSGATQRRDLKESATAT